MTGELVVRRASIGDVDAIRRIYNEGVADRVGTLDIDPKSSEDIADWWARHDERFVVLASISP